MLCIFDITVICFDLEHLESFHRRGVNMSLNMHEGQYGLSQQNKRLQNVEVYLVV